MHLQPVNMTTETAICPQCRVLQNVEVASHDEETDLLAGQLCWYCGYQLRQDELSENGEFKIVLSAGDVPTASGTVLPWVQQMEREYGGKPVDYAFDDAGRCVVTLHPVATTDDLDEPVE